MMVIDMTAQLAPVIDGTVALLAVAAVAVFGAPIAHWIMGRLSSPRRHEQEVVAADVPFRLAA